MLDRFKIGCDHVQQATGGRDARVMGSQMDCLRDVQVHQWEDVVKYWAAPRMSPPCNPGRQTSPDVRKIAWVEHDAAVEVERLQASFTPSKDRRVFLRFFRIDEGSGWRLYKVGFLCRSATTAEIWTTYFERDLASQRFRKYLENHRDLVKV